MERSEEPDADQAARPGWRTRQRGLGLRWLCLNSKKVVMVVWLTRTETVWLPSSS